MANPKNLLMLLTEAEQQPSSAGLDLRLALSKLVLAALRRKGWSQKQLADAAGMKQSFVTRVVHADQNCTFEVAGRMLTALGVNATLVSNEESSRDTRPKHQIETPNSYTFFSLGNNYDFKSQNYRVEAHQKARHGLISFDA